MFSGSEDSWVDWGNLIIFLQKAGGIKGGGGKQPTLSVGRGGSLVVFVVWASCVLSHFRPGG